MQLQDVMNKLDEFSEKMLLHYSAPNKDLVVEVMQYDANSIPELPDSQLSKYIFVLGQYLNTLKYNENLKSAERALISKSLEFNIHKVKLDAEFPAGMKTEKDKRAWLITSREDLNDLEMRLTVAEAEETLISGMSDAVKELLNALKKEKSSRGASGEY